MSWARIDRCSLCTSSSPFPIMASDKIIQALQGSWKPSSGPKVVWMLGNLQTDISNVNAVIVSPFHSFELHLQLTCDQIRKWFSHKKSHGWKMNLVLSKNFPYGITCFKQPTKVEPNFLQWTIRNSSGTRWGGCSSGGLVVWSQFSCQISLDMKYPSYSLMHPLEYECVWMIVRKHSLYR